MKTICELAREGSPIEAPFIDVHGHFGPWNETFVPWARDHARLIDEMDRFGCDMVWMTASDPGYAGPMAWKNDLVFRDEIAKVPEITARLSPEKLARAFDYNRQLANVDAIFERVLGK